MFEQDDQIINERLRHGPVNHDGVNDSHRVTAVFRLVSLQPLQLQRDQLLRRLTQVLQRDRRIIRQTGLLQGLSQRRQCKVPEVRSQFSDRPQQVVVFVPP